MIQLNLINSIHTCTTWHVFKMRHFPLFPPSFRLKSLCASMKKERKKDSQLFQLLLLPLVIDLNLLLIKG